MNTHPLIIEDCTVLYSRSHGYHVPGGGIFNMRGSGHGSGGYTITFRNIIVEDPRPTLQPFKIIMECMEIKKFPFYIVSSRIPQKRGGG